MSITTRSASARKVTKARKLAIGLSASGGDVNNVKLSLKKGSKTVAKGKLAKLSGKGKVTLKLKKLRKGSYRMIATGTDSSGKGVSAGATLKVKK